MVLKIPRVKKKMRSATSLTENKNNNNEPGPEPEPYVIPEWGLEVDKPVIYLYPEKDITAKISDAVLSPTTGEIYNPVFTPEDEKFYEQYGAVPHSDPARFKPEYL